MEILEKSVKEIHGLLKNRVLKCRDLIIQTYKNIEQQEPEIQSFISLAKEESISRSEEIDRLYDKGEELPVLAGIPIAVKDNICIKGQKTTCASRMLADFVAPYDATVTKKLTEHYMIPVGKLNMDEFAMGSSTENSVFHTTRNPWSLDCVPGGSSGGSTASVAAGQVPLSLGSDTGGSIRQPAAFCGVTGFKPTYGRVSRYGLVAFASSLDQIGPVAKNVEDISCVLNAISGHDSMDSTSADIAVPDFTLCLGKDIKGLKIGVPAELFGPAINSDVRQCVINGLELLSKEGACWEEVNMESFPHAIETYYILSSAEASANLARFDGVKYGHRYHNAKNIKEMYKKTRGSGFGSEVKRRIILGTYVLSAGYYDAYYAKAQKMRTLFKLDFAKAFKKYDVLITPSSPTTAFKIGEKIEDPLDMYTADIATIPVNLAGLPAISVPCGFVDGLPAGLQVIGKAFDEETVLKVAYKYQQLTDFHKKKPKLLN
ncbi:MAG: Asp-tRNA(Asn)/Glu-tRNA(Gln) amidotransferase subunit GatA [bacterium]|nr:Asp-tRNA(Asn)/Glu-tRNA(Gln) amidotransferase subunit GatA [bacterium]